MKTNSFRYSECLPLVFDFLFIKLFCALVILLEANDLTYYELNT